MRQFLIARNPEPRSALPYVLGLPVQGGMVWLKAREAWPHNAKVYCHPLSWVPQVETLDVLEQVDTVVCRRIGSAIDLVLARRTNKRSQFVFVHSGERDLIFWQTARTAKAARPGVRIPRQQADPQSVFYVDTREKYAYTFSAHHATLAARALPAGDYAAMLDEAILGVVERKRFNDFVTSLVNGSLNFLMAELAAQPVAAVVVEGTYSALLRHEYTRAGFLPTLVARLQARYPQISLNFLESRQIAEEWTYRFLSALYQSACGLGLAERTRDGTVDGRG